MPQTIAIVGASLTGASAAATLREDGFDGRVVLLGAEPQLPYDRPPLSKAYLRGATPFEKTLLRPASSTAKKRSSCGSPPSSRASAPRRSGPSRRAGGPPASAPGPGA